jgi:hypothetical protein
MLNNCGQSHTWKKSVTILRSSQNVLSQLIINNWYHHPLKFRHSPVSTLSLFYLVILAHLVSQPNIAGSWFTVVWYTLAWKFSSNFLCFPPKFWKILYGSPATKKDLWQCCQACIHANTTCGYIWYTLILYTVYCTL